MMVEPDKKKINHKKFTREETFEIIEDIVNNSLSEAEIALFISAMYEQGMTFYETVDLIDAILASGHKLKLKKRYVADKHCIGGIAGSRWYAPIWHPRLPFAEGDTG